MNKKWPVKVGSMFTYTRTNELFIVIGEGEKKGKKYWIYYEINAETTYQIWKEQMINYSHIIIHHE